MSIVSAKADLYELLSVGDNIAIPELTEVGIGYAYNHEPRPGDAIRNIFVTVSTAGMTPEEVMFNVRVYASPQVSSSEAAAAIDACMDVVDEIIGANPIYGPSNWQGPEYIPELDSFVALARITAYRANS